jgi:hypothetical protein
MTERTSGPVGGNRYLFVFLLVTVLLAVQPQSALARGPVNKVFVESISVECAGDVLSGEAVASGGAGRTFTLSVERPGGRHGSSTGLSRTIALVESSAAYSYSFDISALDADAYVVRADRPSSTSSGDTRSRVVSASECAPPPQVPEAPAALLLPLSVLLTLGLFGLVSARRRRRRIVAAL